MIISGSIEGLDELIKAFAKLGDDAMIKLEPASIACAEKVLHKAKQKLEPHYRTGAAFHSLKVVKPSKKRGVYTLFAKVTFSKSGAHLVPLELGHKIVRSGNTVGTVKEVPILRPAADESKDETVRTITDAMNKILDEMGGMR